MKELEKLDIMEDEEIMELYRKALKGKEEKEKVPKNPNPTPEPNPTPDEPDHVPGPNKPSPEELREEALRKGAELLKNKPDLKTKTECDWGENGTGPNFVMLCELLKGNAIPTKRLNLGCDEIEVKMIINLFM